VGTGSGRLPTVAPVSAAESGCAWIGGRVQPATMRRASTQARTMPPAYHTQNSLEW